MLDRGSLGASVGTRTRGGLLTSTRAMLPIVAARHSPRTGTNVRDVQSSLGHASLATTQRYLRRSQGKPRREAMGGRRCASAVAPDGLAGLWCERQGGQSHSSPAVGSPGTELEFAL